ncbi:LemA family protein [Klebsiella pneumoniae]|nr:LemA family protein [Klebsiella pneumoniae]
MEMYIGLAIVAVILIWAIFTYNRFISLRRFKDEAWSGIAVQLKRRHDLAPNLFSLVKRYAQHEKELLEEIGRQRSVLIGNPQQVADSEQHYAGTLSRVFALAEAYPETQSQRKLPLAAAIPWRNRRTTANGPPLLQRHGPRV